MKSRLLKSIVALLAVLSLVVMTVSSASAGRGPWYELQVPSGINQKQLSYPQLPWEHTVVIAYVHETQPEDTPVNDSSEDIASQLADLFSYKYLSEYVYGTWSLVLDRLIEVDSTSVSINYGGGAHSTMLLGQDSRYGNVAIALNTANGICERSPKNVCDVILVTHTIPTDSTQRRHAMAEAMQIAANGHRLHSVALPPTTCPNNEPSVGCSEAGVTPTSVNPDTAAFSRLLSASGYHVSLDDLELTIYAVHGIIEAMEYTDSWKDNPGLLEDDYLSSDGGVYPPPSDNIVYIDG